MQCYFCLAYVTFIDQCFQILTCNLFCPFSDLPGKHLQQNMVKILGCKGHESSLKMELFQNQPDSDLTFSPSPSSPQIQLLNGYLKV